MPAPVQIGNSHLDVDGKPSEQSIELGLGSIPHCPHNNCGFRCCQFNQGNYIVTYPGELDAAKEIGLSVQHLCIVGTIGGGEKVVCQARDTSTCDNGYKPLDCRSYPFFPNISGLGKIEANLKGSKCPLGAKLVPWHRAWVIRTWRNLATRHPAVYDWLAKVTLVGYRTLNHEGN